MQTPAIAALALTAGSIGFIHTLMGPDHYLPFVAIAKARSWRLGRTLLFTVICGLGHVLGSVVLGVVGICAGLAVTQMEAFEGAGPDEDPREREAMGCLVDASIPVSQFDGFYGGNFALTVGHPETHEELADLYILNSRRAYHLPPKVMAWIERYAMRPSVADELVPSLCFYHVPNYEFHALWESGRAHGIKKEPVCYERDDGRVDP